MAERKPRWKAAAEFILNPRFLLCFGLGWFVTNGWSYALLALGTLFRIRWMVAVASAYMALLWFPFTPENLVTIFLAIAFLRWLFPRDRKTLTRLKLLRREARRKFAAQKAKWLAKRADKHK